jgi:hypothetical protein
MRWSGPAIVGAAGLVACFVKPAATPPPDAAAPGDAPPDNANRIFVTSTTIVPMALGGSGALAAADAICNARAGSAGLGGTFVAWLSTSTRNARDRAELVPAAMLGWVRTGDGLPFAATLAQLVAHQVLYPPRFDEFGRDTTTPVLTGTLVDGTYDYSNNCGGYTSGVVERSPVGAADREQHRVERLCLHRNPLSHPQPRYRRVRICSRCRRDLPMTNPWIPRWTRRRPRPGRLRRSRRWPRLPVQTTCSCSGGSALSASRRWTAADVDRAGGGASRSGSVPRHGSGRR